MDIKKQTAVEWLVSQVEDYFCLLPIDIIDQAKEMEKQQIIDAANYGCDEWMSLEDRYRQGELYYKETYEN